MKFKIITLGCKVNTYESEFMLESMLTSGYFYDDVNPDIIIINTCSVTNMADRKSRKLINQAKKTGAILVVAGCSSQNHQQEYQDMGIDILLGNKDKSQIVELINKYLKDKKQYTNFTNSRILPFENMTVKKFTTHTRAFIKIQDGCHNFCSYCIIPYVRGNPRSKNFNEAIEEAKTLVKNGHKEIVLTGIHTGSYNSDNHDLADLIREMAQIDGLDRIRISSIEITELNSKFLELLKNEPKIANHLHIPMQSGSDEILKKMNRKYDKNYFKEKIKEIRKIRPNISITTDCIVGHPFETDACFLEYLDFIKEINFSKLHVFPYSIRSGTPSASMPQINDEVKKERVKTLLNLSNKLENSYYQKFVNQELTIIAEEYYKDYTVGFTSNYIKIYLKGKYPLNKEYHCLITKVDNSHVFAQRIPCPNK